MTTQVIPLVSDVNYNFTIQLAGVPFRFDIVWNPYGEYYVMDITNLSTTVSFRGIKLVLDTELIRKFSSADLPNGAIVVVNTDKSKTRVNFEDFDETARLLFVPQADLENI